MGLPKRGGNVVLDELARRDVARHVQITRSQRPPAPRANV